MKKCPCHSGLPYSHCCQPFHNGNPPLNARALMRSRYAAYALNQAEYIIKTTHPNNPIYQKNFSKWTQELEMFASHTQFTGLEILDFIDGKNEAFVSFRAELNQSEVDTSFTEKSRFLKKNNNWYYLSGVISS